MTACTCVTNVFVRVLEWSEMTAVRAVSGQHHAIEMYVHCMGLVLLPLFYSSNSYSYRGRSSTAASACDVAGQRPSSETGTRRDEAIAHHHHRAPADKSHSSSHAAAFAHLIQHRQPPSQQLLALVRPCDTRQTLPPHISFHFYYATTHQHLRMFRAASHSPHQHPYNHA